MSYNQKCYLIVRYTFFKRITVGFRGYCSRRNGTRTHSGKNGCVTQLLDVYNPREVEREVHEFWHNQPKLQPNPAAKEINSKYFSMILPPPNITGSLHLGHTLTVAIQDVLARWHRMQGEKVLWIPGFDHAGIATQSAFEKRLWKEKQRNRYDLGRKELVDELWSWKHEKEMFITNQLKHMGASLDWSHQYFTLDKYLSAAVMDAFIQLHSDGLIYRAESIINWCCKLQSAISDMEVDHIEISGPEVINVPNYEEPIEFGVLKQFAYKSPNGCDELVVSTTRLETMLGDTAVAVHPADERYLHWHGAHVWHPFLEKALPVICDDSVDPHFGTGVVKITPAHSLLDYETGKKHNLPIISVIDERGRMNENCRIFKGLKRFHARVKIQDELTKLGVFRGQKEHAMSVPVCSRTGDIVEFLLKPQWFLSCQDMAKVAVEAVEKGKLEITPSSYKNVWFTWLNNIRDWCISRQVWWGHQIPAFECYLLGSTEKIWVAAKDVGMARHIAANKLNLSPEEEEIMIVTQDVDVLDTWFSSALLPFSALGWPYQAKDLEQYYPLSVMETGHDILFFWVARMVMLGTYITGKLPFEKVILHGIVCDSYGRKMSKSLGNVIDPLDVINGASAEHLLQRAQANFESGLISAEELNRTLKSNETTFPKGIPQCGSDALRFTLCSQNVGNAHINFDVSACVKNQQFCTKIWQACRYIQGNYSNLFDKFSVLEKAPRSKFDKWIVSRLAYLVQEVDSALQAESFHFAISAMKNFVVNELCTIYLEGTKTIVKAGDPTSVRAIETLILCMDVALRILHPFMPFVTEHLYQRLPLRKELHSSQTIALAPYPSPAQWASSRDKVLDDEIQDVLTVVSAFRLLQSTYRITKKDERWGYILSSSDGMNNRCKEHLDLIRSLSSVMNIEVIDYNKQSLLLDAVHTVVNPSCSVYLKSSVEKDQEKELREKQRRYKVIVKDLEKLLKITSNPGYKSSAPEQVQIKHREKIVNLEAEINELKKYHKLSESKERSRRE